MSSYGDSITAQFDNLRSLGHASISSSYAAIGGAFAFPARVIILDNNTNGDLLISTDGLNDKTFVPANGFKLIDIASNMSDPGGQLTVPKNTTIYVKESTAPTTGSIYLTVIYAL